MKLALTLISCSLLVACANTSTKTHSTIKEMKNLNEDSTYKSQSLLNTATVNESPVTLSFDKANKRAFGSTGCNKWSANYEINNNSISFSSAISTRMMCINPVVMQQEDIFLKAIPNIQSYSYTKNALELKTINGESLIFIENSI